MYRWSLSLQLGTFRSDVGASCLGLSLSQGRGGGIRVCRLGSCGANLRVLGFVALRFWDFGLSEHWGCRVEGQEFRAGVQFFFLVFFCFILFLLLLYIYIYIYIYIFFFFGGGGVGFRVCRGLWTKEAGS